MEEKDFIQIIDVNITLAKMIVLMHIIFLVALISSKNIHQFLFTGGVYVFGMLLIGEIIKNAGRCQFRKGDRK